MTTTNDPSPQPHATAEQVEAARHDSKLAQVLYHDWEAESYDDKWSISYDKRCVDYARDLFDATVPAEELRELPYDRALELGCGSGFFLLNLIQAGVARRGSVTDLSPGMVRWPSATARISAWRSTAASPTRRASLRRRHLRPRRRSRGAAPHSRRRAVAARARSGAQAGRPIRVRRRADDCRQRLRARPFDRDVARGDERDQAARCSPGGGARRRVDESSRAAALEAIVDLHTFEPYDLEGMARNAGAVDVSSATTEFTAAMLGWPLRTFEAAAPPGGPAGVGRSSPSAAGSH